ncbi:MAG: ABC transporter permease subunit [Acidobacteria bacterium]|nr:ABC transporter permease subunit [Acidobacteriota bacterium]
MLLALLHRSFRRARALLMALAAVLAAFQVLVVLAAGYLHQQGGFSQVVALLPPMAQQLMGGVFSSFGSMVAFGYFHPVVIIVMVGLAIVVASEPAADVESGVVDLVLARPIRRGHLVTRSLLMLLLTTSIIASLMVAASWSSLQMLAPPGASLRAAVVAKLATNLVAVAWAAGALALAVASLAKRRGAAAGGVAIVVLALYLLNVLAEINPRIRPYAPLSPFHYYQPIGIVSGMGTRWAGDVSLLVGVAAVFAAVAFVAYSKRDL